ncbi:helix-turn-helix transcriptional regulator [Exilibacterium tricleocarpae]|uniref:Helix-turn-helix transcriptional regulator n=1 Tax=Exilibacterium tricleocarpae TaxID=2591008 RepID=A0A545TLC8_9GAMM|nr:helix-turn-helix transcriptional regulator [Exilibacterium tricleocarpae]TQV78025.1 helix-turn-helix transcriptional regulator [Exilibacterium tricleocarpae]
MVVDDNYALCRFIKLVLQNEFRVSAVAIEVNLNSADPNYGIEHMAKNLGIDKHNLYRYVKDYFDQSPTDLLLTARLERARGLIENADIPVSKVAYDCGFNNVSYFNRSLKNITA